MDRETKPGNLNNPTEHKANTKKTYSRFASSQDIVEKVNVLNTQVKM